jgi:hypothetical protein
MARQYKIIVKSHRQKSKVYRSKTPKGGKKTKKFRLKNFDVLLRRLTVKSDAK